MSAVMDIALREMRRQNIDVSKGRIRVFRDGQLYGIIFGDADRDPLQLHNADVMGYEMQIDASRNFEIVTSHYRR